MRAGHTEDPRTEVGEEVGVGVCVGPVEFSYKQVQTEQDLQAQGALNCRLNNN